jgi:hypothetical protein
MQIFSNLFGRIFWGRVIGLKSFPQGFISAGALKDPVGKMHDIPQKVRKVVPQAIAGGQNFLNELDSRFRGNDEIRAQLHSFSTPPEGLLIYPSGA